MSIDLEFLMDCGKPFQAVGLTIAKERSPNVNIVLGTTKSSRISERKPGWPSDSGRKIWQCKTRPTHVVTYTPEGSTWLTSLHQIYVFVLFFREMQIKFDWQTDFRYKYLCGCVLFAAEWHPTRLYLATSWRRLCVTARQRSSCSCWPRIHLWNPTRWLEYLGTYRLSVCKWGVVVWFCQSISSLVVDGCNIPMNQRQWLF